VAQAPSARTSAALKATAVIVRCVRMPNVPP
jgi:hypothetical protein